MPRGSYAAALRHVQPRLAPLIRVPQSAALLDPALNALWQGISQRRAANMRLLAKDLAATGRLRPGLSETKIADIIWSIISPEFYLLQSAGWGTRGFFCWWSRRLLRALT